jgi:hypothetical protein
MGKILFLGLIVFEVNLLLRLFTSFLGTVSKEDAVLYSVANAVGMMLGTWIFDIFFSGKM